MRLFIIGDGDIIGGQQASIADGQLGNRIAAIIRMRIYPDSNVMEQHPATFTIEIKPLAMGGVHCIGDMECEII